MKSSQDNSSTASISIVIPAHNEETVLGRCLSALMDGAKPGELEVIVVCNGCSDDTAKIGRSYGPGVIVIETDIPSKVNALNMGDQAAKAFPRFYVDADVVMSIDSLRRVAEALREGKCLAAAPKMRVDLKGCSLVVKAFYAIWMKHPYFNSMIGSGVYALSAKGRERFESFPNITADDEFVRRLFTDQERMTVPETTFTVTPPRNVNDLIKIKTRARRGNMELESRFPSTRKKKGGGGMSQFLGILICHPLVWPAVPIYIFVQAAAWKRAKKTFKQAGPSFWERDQSTRVASSDLSQPTPKRNSGA